MTYNVTPHDHTSAALPSYWPCRLSTSGAMYAGVPTADFGAESIKECLSTQNRKFSTAELLLLLLHHHHHHRFLVLLRRYRSTRSRASNLCARRLSRGNTPPRDELLKEISRFVFSHASVFQDSVEEFASGGVFHHDR